LNRLKKFFMPHQHKLIEMIAKTNAIGSLISNIIVPCGVVAVFYKEVPSIYLFSWLLGHLVMFFGRFYVVKKLFNAIKLDDNDLINKYLNIYFVIISIVSILYGAIVWLSVIYADDSYSLFIGMVVVAVVGVSLATFSSVFYIFISFVSLQIILFICAFIYHGGEIFYVAATLAVTYMIVLLSIGHEHYMILRDSITLKNTFKTIYNKSSDGIVLASNNRFVDCNEAIVNMFAYDSKEDMFKGNIFEIMPKYQPDGKLSIRKMIKKMKEAYEIGSNEFEWLHNTIDGEEFWCQIRLTCINLDGQYIIHGTLRDITDRKQLEKEAQQTALYLKNLNASLEKKVQEAVQEMKDKERVLYQQSRLAQMGEMMSMIAHQWRQPLSAISATSIGLNLKAQLNKADKKLIETATNNISEYSQHLSQTIDDFRDFFKPTKEKKFVNFNELIKSALNIVEVSLKNRNIEVLQELDESDLFESYPNELKQVILNLIKNAEDALIENKIKNPVIKISTCQDGSKHILKVSDNGGGISEDIIDNIFDPYFSTKKDKNGTGLGLYMSKTIIQDHCKGSLEVVNSAEGAIFTITI